MQRSYLCASVVSLLAGLGASPAALAGQPHGHGYHGRHPALVPVNRPSDTRRTLPAAQTTPAALIALPLGSPRPSLPVLAIDADSIQPHHPSQPRGLQSRPEMLSGNPVGPGTVISRLPSGSIVMQSHAQYLGFYHGRRHHQPIRSAAPYAPPSFQIIGAAPARHMGSPVKLTYGTPVNQRLNPSPRVIWIKAEKPGRSIAVIK